MPDGLHDSADSLAVLVDWFSKAPTASLELPDGWFGRPYDSRHQLTWTAERDNKVFIELDCQLHLILSDPEVVEMGVARTELRCTQLVFDWRGFGSSGVRHAHVYGDGGSVRFHATEVPPG